MDKLSIACQFRRNPSVLETLPRTRPISLFVQAKLAEANNQASDRHLSEQRDERACRLDAERRTERERRERPVSQSERVRTRRISYA